MHLRGQADQFLLLYLCSTCWPGTNLGRLHNFQTIIARIIGWETVPWPYRRVWSMVVNIYLGPFYRCTLKHLTPAQLSRKSPQGEELMMIPAPSVQKKPYTKSTYNHYNPLFLNQNVPDFDNFKCNPMPYYSDF